MRSSWYEHVLGMRTFLFLCFLALCQLALGAEVIITIPDDRMEKLLDDTFHWFHTFGEQSPVYGKSDSEKLAYCMDQVLPIASFGKVQSLKEIEATVEVKR